MSISFRTAAIFSTIWISFKMTTFYLNVLQKPEELFVSIFFNIFCLLGTVSFGLYFIKKNQPREDSSALGDMKSAMSAGMLYTLIVGFFFYLYYEKINPSFNQYRIAKADTEIERDVNNEKKLALFKSKNPDFKGLNNDEIISKMKQGPRQMFSSSFTTTIGFLGMTVLSTVYSILVTAIFRRFLFPTLGR